MPLQEHHDQLPSSTQVWRQVLHAASRHDLKGQNALDGLLSEIWNEPDIFGFWGRGIQQWVDLWVRTHKRIRRDSAFAKVPISGPSLANNPDVANPYWNTWGPQARGNNTWPDEYAWHLLEGPGSADPDIGEPLFRQWRQAFGAPNRAVNINEYARIDEQTPSGYAYWIARLERYNWAGMLGLWGAPLYDNFANLLTKRGDATDEKNNNYAWAAGYPLYKYYVQSMKGPRALTIGSTDRKFDIFSTVGPSGDRVRIIAGARAQTGSYTLNLRNLASVGYANGQTVNAEYWGYYGQEDSFAIYGDAPFLGTQSVTVQNGQANLNVAFNDRFAAFRIEIRHL